MLRLLIRDITVVKGPEPKRLQTGHTTADTDLRATITTLELSYVAGIMPKTSVWPIRQTTAATEELVGQS